MTARSRYPSATLFAALSAVIQSNGVRAFSLAGPGPSRMAAAGKTRLFSSTSAGVDRKAGADRKRPGGAILSPDDEAALLEASDFPIPPDELVERCKTVIAAQGDIQDEANFDESIYADDFRFVAPFVGGPSPRSDGASVAGLSKSEYLAALRGFDLLDAFPDMDNRYHGFYVDPFEPNRVWFRTRCTATHTGDLMGNPPTHKRLELPPQSFSMTFDEAGRLTKFDVGYVTDRTVGNTGGLGGAFGFFWGTGNPLPFPECEPFAPSWQLRLLGLLGDLRKRLGGD